MAKPVRFIAMEARSGLKRIKRAQWADIPGLAGHDGASCLESAKCKIVVRHRVHDDVEAGTALSVGARARLVQNPRRSFLCTADIIAECPGGTGKGTRCKGWQCWTLRGSYK
eukprot:scaffold32112_cov115-Isochrysis_galbana.AAC.2